MKRALAIEVFDYSTLDSETRRFLEERAEKIHDLARMTAQGIVQIGQLLTEAKERVGHGQFLDWIKKSFAWDRTTAWRFMEVYDKVKCCNLQQMDIDVSSLYLIAKPSTPEPVRTEVIRRAEGGEPITHEAVVELRKRYEETGELPASTTKLIAMALDAKREMAERNLPTPSQARKRAIETGAHTLDNTGTYQPPVTKLEQEQWNQDWTRVSGLNNFLRWSSTSALSPKELAAIIRKRRWTKEFTTEALTAAIERLNGFRDELTARAEPPH